MFEDALSDDEDFHEDNQTTSPKRTEENTIKYDEADDDEEQENNKIIEHNNEDEAISNSHEELKDFVHNVIVTNASMDITNLGNGETSRQNHLDELTEENNSSLDTCIETHGLVSPARSACVSPASSNGGVYTVIKNYKK